MKLEIYLFDHLSLDLIVSTYISHVRSALLSDVSVLYLDNGIGYWYGLSGSLSLPNIEFL